MREGMWSVLTMLSMVVVTCCATTDAQPVKVTVQGPDLPQSEWILGYEVLPLRSPNGDPIIFSLRLHQVNNTALYYGSLLRLDATTLKVTDKLELPGPVPTLDDYKFYAVSTDTAICLATLWLNGGFSQQLLLLDLSTVRVTACAVVATARVYDNGGCLVPCPAQGFANAALSTIFLTKRTSDNKAVILDGFSVKTLKPLDDGVNRTVTLSGQVEVTDLATTPGARTVAALARNLQQCEIWTWDVKSWHMRSAPVNCTYYKADPTPLVAGAGGSIVAWMFNVMETSSTSAAVGVWDGSHATSVAVPDSQLYYGVGVGVAAHSLYASVWPDNRQQAFEGQVSRFESVGGSVQESHVRLANTTVMAPVPAQGEGVFTLAVLLHNPQPPPAAATSSDPPPSSISIYPVIIV